MIKRRNQLFGRLLLAGLALMGGCRKKTPLVVDGGAALVAVVQNARLTEVRVVDRTPVGSRVTFDEAALAKVAGEALRVHGGLGAPDENGPAYRLRLSVAMEETPDGAKASLRAVLGARLEPIGAEPGGLTFDDSAAGEKAIEAGPRAPEWDSFLAKLSGDLMKTLGARVRLLLGDSASLLDALGSPEPELREEAVRLAAERKEKRAVPALVKLLSSEDLVLRDRAIGALAMIGDRRAVRPLTEVARFRDVSDLPKVLDALAAIGGEEARVYIDFVATGHEDSDMRALAKAALQRLDRRKP